MKKPIYFDYAATTPADPRVVEKMMQYLTMDGVFANPASRSHRYGWQAEAAVEEARNQLANLIHADPREIVWTSGATESNNLAIKGAAFAYQHKGKHIITSKIEHKAVLDPCAYLQEQGFEVTYLPPDQRGLISLEQVTDALRDDTILVSLMHVNNEIGVINPIAEIAQLTYSKDVLFHVDAAQSVGKLAIDLKQLPVDLLSISAHKMYGPKGIGALYVRRSPKVNLVAQIHGGGHERGMRSGTLATHQIVGFGEAAAIAEQGFEQENSRILALKKRFWQGVKHLKCVRINGDQEQRVAGNVNLCFTGVDGETLIMALKDVAVSSGSACTSADIEPSYVLQALGLSRADAHSSLRFSFGRFTSEEDVDYAIEHVCSVVERLQK